MTAYQHHTTPTPPPHPPTQTTAILSTLNMISNQLKLQQWLAMQLKSHFSVMRCILFVKIEIPDFRTSHDVTHMLHF